MTRNVALAIAVLLASATAATSRQVAPPWSAPLAHNYKVVKDITFVTANNYDVKLDVYMNVTEAASRPTVVFVPGGAWNVASKDAAILHFMPWLEWGFHVVAVNHRPLSVAVAPAAVEDCVCALRWVIQHAQEYHFDLSRIVATGESSGGHLAMLMAMAPATERLDAQCPAREPLKVALVVNWFGSSDLLDPPSSTPGRLRWIGSRPDWEAMARRMSPLTYARAGLPPVLTIHGDADAVVGFNQATKLRSRLDSVGVENQLLVIPGGNHGTDTWSVAENQRAWSAVREFVVKHDVWPRDALSNSVKPR